MGQLFPMWTEFDCFETELIKEKGDVTEKISKKKRKKKKQEFKNNEQ